LVFHAAYEAGQRIIETVKQDTLLNLVTQTLCRFAAKLLNPTLTRAIAAKAQLSAIGRWSPEKSAGRIAEFYQSIHLSQKMKTSNSWFKELILL
jgi:hypothetical protein